MVAWEHADDVFKVVEKLKTEGFSIAAIEQTPAAIRLPDFSPPDKLALVVGREVEGIEPEVLAKADTCSRYPCLARKSHSMLSRLPPWGCIIARSRSVYGIIKPRNNKTKHDTRSTTQTTGTP